MDYVEFVSEVKKMGIVIEYTTAPTWIKSKQQPRTPAELQDAFISVKWVSGGVTGGNCWRDGPFYSVDAEPAEDLVALDTILENICPSISFLVYKRLVNQIVTQESDRHNDYYGNHTNFIVKKAKLKDLYGFLQENGFINGD